MISIPLVCPVTRSVFKFPFQELDISVFFKKRNDCSNLKLELCRCATAQPGLQVHPIDSTWPDTVTTEGLGASPAGLIIGFPGKNPGLQFKVKISGRTVVSATTCDTSSPS
jgi:hypothetical protein